MRLLSERNCKKKQKGYGYGAFPYHPEKVHGIRKHLHHMPACIQRAYHRFFFNERITEIARFGFHLELFTNASHLITTKFFFSNHWVTLKSGMPLSLLLSTYVPPTYSFIRFLQIDDQYTKRLPSGIAGAYQRSCRETRMGTRETSDARLVSTGRH